MDKSTVSKTNEESKHGLGKDRQDKKGKRK